MREIYDYEHEQDFGSQEEEDQLGHSRQALVKDAQGEQEAEVGWLPEEPTFPDPDAGQAAHVAARAQYGEPPTTLRNPEALSSALASGENHYYGMFGQIDADASPDPHERMLESIAKMGYGVGESQPFIDGNKRTARLLMEGTGRENGLAHVFPTGHDDEELADHLKGYGVRLCPTDDTQLDENGRCSSCGEIPQDGGRPRHTLQDTLGMLRQRHHQGGPNEYESPYPHDDHRQANILDPIHPGLDERVWDNPDDSAPMLKHDHAAWIANTVWQTLERAGYDGMGKWLSLVFTGSLTTYQYSDESDVDISLFVNTANFPEWSRAEMIGVMIEHCDGLTMPGTPFPLQCFVVPPEIKREDLYKPGLRSGWDLGAKEWIVPPDPERVHDVEAEMNASYTLALENADKMERLLRFEPNKAIMFWHQIHKRRKRDHQAGRGDYCLAPETKVLTSSYEWKPIAELVVGEALVGFDEEVQGQSRDGTTRGLQRGFRRTFVESTEIKRLPAFQIGTDKTTPIVASANHLWLVRLKKQVVGWKATSELRAGDEIIYFGDPWAAPVDPVEAAYLAGLVDGEGHITKLGRLSFAQKRGLVMERGKQALDVLGFRYGETHTEDQTGQYDLAAHVQLYGGVAATMRFLYQVPTVRLRTQQPDFWIGRQISPKGRYLEADKCVARIESVEDIGEAEVVALTTSTRTLIAEGLYSHNSDSNVTYKMLSNRGLFPKISEISGEYIAKAAKVPDPAIQPLFGPQYQKQVQDLQDEADSRFKQTRPGDPSAFAWMKQPDYQRDGLEQEHLTKAEYPGWDQYYYHIAPTEARARMQAHGIQTADPTLGETSMSVGRTPEELQAWVDANGRDALPTGAYLFNHPGRALRYRTGLSGNHDVWRVPKDSVSEVKKDPDMSSEVFSPHPVSDVELWHPYWPEARVATSSPQQILDQNAGQDLAGLPSRVNIPGVGKTQWHSHGGIQALAQDYMSQAGLPYQPPTTYKRVNPQTGAQIAEAYEQMPHASNDPDVRASYDALIRETKAQYDHATNNGYQFEFYPEQDPYPDSPRQAILDLHHNQHMYVYPTHDGYGSSDDVAQDHPLLGDSGVRWNEQPVTHNDLFRAVHDFYGHAKEGVGFRADGEDNAWQAHSAMFSPEARSAMTAETRGQNSWVNFGPHGTHNQTADAQTTVFAPQKAGVLPSWTMNPDIHDQQPTPVTAHDHHEEEDKEKPLHEVNHTHKGKGKDNRSKGVPQISEDSGE